MVTALNAHMRMQEGLSKSIMGLDAVKQALGGCIDGAVQSLQTVMLAPKATYIACLAALIVLRQPLKAITPWHRCRCALADHAR